MEPVYTPPFLLIQRNGTVAEFNDIVALRAALRAAGICISEHHMAYRTLRDGVYALEHNEWIVRDDCGSVVTAAAVRHDPSTEWWCSRRDRVRDHAAARGLPIPFTGRRGGYGCVLRHPKSNGSHRAHAALHDERHGERAKGRIKRPPTAWDDVPRKDFSHRSWKRHRRNQYRAVEVLGSDQQPS